VFGFNFSARANPFYDRPAEVLICSGIRQYADGCLPANTRDGAGL